MVTQNRVEVEVYGGIDTHADTHHVAVIDALGRRLDDIQIPATPAGYRTAVRFLQSQGGLVTIGIECTGLGRVQLFPPRERGRHYTTRNDDDKIRLRQRHRCGHRCRAAAILREQLPHRPTTGTVSKPAASVGICGIVAFGPATRSAGEKS